MQTVHSKVQDRRVNEERDECYTAQNVIGVGSHRNREGSREGQEESQTCEEAYGDWTQEIICEKFGLVQRSKMLWLKRQLSHHPREDLGARTGLVKWILQ